MANRHDPNDPHAEWCHFQGCDCGYDKGPASVEDLQAIAQAAGLPQLARPYSPHEFIVRDLIPAIEQLRKGAVPDGILEHIEMQSSLITRLLRPAPRRQERE